MRTMSEEQAERILRQAGMLVDVPAGQKLQIMQGDVVRVSITFDYRGPAQSVTPYASIGKQWPLFFDEIASAPGLKKRLTQSFTYLSYTGYVDINSSNCPPEANYDLFVKLLEYPGQTAKLIDVIDVLGLAEFRNFAITEYVKLV